MKLVSVFLFLAVHFIFILGCASRPTRDDSNLPSVDQFKSDLTSINYNLWGKLQRYSPEYKDGLSTLTYDRYLVHIKEVRGERPHRLLSEISKADSHQLRSTANDFEVCFKSKNLTFVICDRASTVEVDLIVRSLPLPSIEEVISKIGPY